jgi:hypothetical protein
MRSNGLRLGFQTRFGDFRRKNPGASFGHARIRTRGRKHAQQHAQDEEPQLPEHDHGQQSGG